MNYYLGIDIGTSSTKAVCFDTNGHAVASASKDYELYVPKPGYAEEDPEDWFDAVCTVIRTLASTYRIKGIGLSGQMHGLVLLDRNDTVLRPSIIWCDNRATEEAKEIQRRLPGKIKKITKNEVQPAFTLAKLLWVQNHEKKIYEQIDKVLLPKDYIAYRLTDTFKTEYSDASGTQWLDLEKKTYSDEILEAFAINRAWLPALQESSEIRGVVQKALCAELNLPQDCFVVGGAGDQAAAAIGNGILKKGDVSLVLGSSGVVFSPVFRKDLNQDTPLQVFMHAIPDTYHVMGVTNGCGLSYRWYKETLTDRTYDQLNEGAALSKPGAHGLIYLPYLNGERTPHLDPYARGCFLGIAQDTSQNDFTRAVLEGISYSLKDCFSLLNLPDASIRISGGGAKGDLWRTIIASVFKRPVYRICQEEGGALGVAILAMVAGKDYQSVDEACEKLIRLQDETKPVKDWETVYEKGYDHYRLAYRSLKDYFVKVQDQ